MQALTDLDAKESINFCCENGIKNLLKTDTSWKNLYDIVESYEWAAAGFTTENSGLIEVVKDKDDNWWRSLSY